MYIIEIYSSLQGESSFAGLPCIFVRLTGCNLRCTWCDSEYTFTGGKKMSPTKVLAEVERLQPLDLRQYFGRAHLFPTGEGVLAVAPGAAQVAPREANEDAGQSRKRRFALQR